MTWLEIAAIVVLLMGVGAGGYLVSQRPTFWVGLGTAILTKLLPLISVYVLKRNTPEVEATMAECVRRGGKWNNFTKRCE